MIEKKIPVKDGFQPADRDVRGFGFRLESLGWIRYKRLKHYLSPAKQSLVVFVAGAQRSGTNMLMDCLDWSGETDAYHESDPRAFRNYQLLPRDVIHSLVESSSFPCVPIKALCEAEQILELLDEFKPAKAIWVIRDFRDTVNSAIRNFPDFTDRVREIAEDPRSAPGWFARGISDQTLSLIRKLNYPDMNSASASAIRWYIRNVLYFEQGLERDDRVMLVRYSDLVTNPVDTLRSIFSFAGLGDFSPFITRKVHAKSIKKNPEPGIHPEIREVCMSLQDRFDKVIK